MYSNRDQMKHIRKYIVSWKLKNYYHSNNENAKIAFDKAELKI